MGRCPHRKALLLLWQRGFKVLLSPRKRPLLLNLNMGLILSKEIWDYKICSMKLHGKA
jgi:hypothetical protein